MQSAAKRGFRLTAYVFSGVALAWVLVRCQCRCCARVAWPWTRIEHPIDLPCGKIFKNPMLGLDERL